MDVDYTDPNGDLQSPQTTTTSPINNNPQHPQWHCLVCKRQLPSLFVLPCQHKFCDTCLHHWLVVYTGKYMGHRSSNKFPCQICWQLYSPPAEGTVAYRQDRDMAQLEAEMANMILPCQSETSENCGESNMNTIQEPVVVSNANIENSNIPKQSRSQMERLMNYGTSYGYAYGVCHYY